MRTLFDEGSSVTYEALKAPFGPFFLTAREVLARCPQVKKQLWGGEFWSDGYFASTVGKHGNEGMIGEYVKKQGQDYKKHHSDRQLGLF